MSLVRCLLVLSLLSKITFAFSAENRVIEFTYKVTVPPLKASDLPVRLAIPIAPSTEDQTILSRGIESSPGDSLVDSKIMRDPTYGNEYWTWKIDQARSVPTTISFNYKILIRSHLGTQWQDKVNAVYGPEEKASLGRFLQADRRVPIDGELVQKLQRELPASAKFPVQKAKAIYDYVIDHMEYKKVGKGWGQGDTAWACSEKYGNCTDFHALLTSMARAEGIPSKFVIGFSVPQDKSEGEISGYHCWLNIYLPQLGWVPVDASEAKKNPKLREFFFGQHTADRILFSIGRDIKLPEMQTDLPLNFWIHPYVEKQGKVVADLVVSKYSFKAP